MKKFLFIVILSASFLFTTQTFAADAAKIFTDKCAACHGLKGEGNPMGPALKGSTFITKGTEDAIKKVILEGRPAKDKKYPNIAIEMPKNLISDEEAGAMVNFLQGDLQK